MIRAVRLKYNDPPCPPRPKRWWHPLAGLGMIATVVIWAPPLLLWELGRMMWDTVAEWSD